MERNRNRIKRNFNDFIATLYGKNATTITFKVTEDCNLKCTYCYQTNKSKNKMKFETAKFFIDKILSNELDYVNTDKYAGAVIEFIGGEPLLETDLIDKICEYWENKIIELNHPWSCKYRFNICSNGIRYFDDDVQNLLKKYHSVMSFGISIDGDKKLHDACRLFPNGNGSYDLASKAAKHYIENYDSEMSTKMTLAPENIMYLSDAIISLINDIGYKEINLNCEYENVWKHEHEYIMYSELKKVADYLIDNDIYNDIYLSIYDENGFVHLNDEKNQNYCGGLGSMIAIDYRGDIYPCIRYMESSLGKLIKPYKIGDINHGVGFDADSKYCLDSFVNVTRTSQSPKNCNECGINSNCGWCSALNYQEFGTINKRTTYICGMHKARALANAYYWNKIFDKEKSDYRFKLNLSDDECLKIISKFELEEIKSFISDEYIPINK